MEEWRDLKGYEGLIQVSNLGRVKSFAKCSEGRILNPTRSDGWYLQFSARGKQIRVHVAVAETFLGDIPKGYHVHHIDGNRQNNAASNLQIVEAKLHQSITLSEHPNMTDNMIHRNIYGQRHVIQQSLNGDFIAEYANSQIASDLSGVCARNIMQVANKTPYDAKGNVRSQAGGFRWIFADESEVI